MENKSSKRSLAFFIFAFYALWALRVFLLEPPLSVLRSAHPELAQISNEVLRLLIWVLPVFIYLRFTENEESPLTFLQIKTPINLKWTLYFTPIFLIWFFIALYTGKYAFQPEMNVFVFIFFKILGVPVMEEILFRGFIQNALLKHFSFAKANLIQAALFMASHFAWIYFFGLTTGVLINFLTVFILGLWFGFLTRKTNSLFPSIVWHLANNILLNLSI